MMTSRVGHCGQSCAYLFARFLKKNLYFLTSLSLSPSPTARAWTSWIYRRVCACLCVCVNTPIHIGKASSLRHLHYADCSACWELRGRAISDHSV